MASLGNVLKQKLEHLFGMQTGYVLDFSNATFGDFVQTSLGFNPYDRYEGSKASILRQIWRDEPQDAVAKLTLEMLDRWKANKLIHGESITSADQALLDDIAATFKADTAVDGHAYDIAVSFAGEHRDYVSRTVDACKQLGLKVFYDKDKNNEWWGSNYIRQQRNIYSSETRFFVPFLSAEYMSKPIPMDEFSSAMMTAVKQGDGYILPVLMDDTKIPPDLLHPHIHYLRASEHTPEQLARELLRKVQGAKAGGQEPADIGPTVERALRVRMPKIVPHDWSKYRELDAAFDHVAKRFQEGADQLADQHLICTVKVRDDKITARVERGGDTIAGIDIRRGGSMGDDHITWAIGYRNMSENSHNGWAVPEFDKEQGAAYLNINDLTMMLSGGQNPHADAEGLFEHLWALLIEQVERA